MNGTTFPSYDGEDQNEHSSGGSGGYNNYDRNQGGSYNNQGGYQKKQWQGQNGGGQGGQGGWQKKPWQGGGGGGRKWNPPAQDTDMTVYRPYTVFSNDGYPPEIQAKFERIVKKLEERGFTMRYSALNKIDAVVEPIVTKKELYLPWRGFAEKDSKLNFTIDRAMAVAKMYHPAYDSMKDSVKKFLACNARKLMGDKMVSPSIFALCWTEDGVENVREKTMKTGFSGHPIAIASAVPIPIYNLGKPDAEDRLNFFLETIVDG